MQIDIRQERDQDIPQVSALIQAAFSGLEESDQSEHLLVGRLRASEAFIPELSLVAVHEETIVGHILLTRIQIQEGDHSFPSLALAPVSVLPEYQGQGIGSQLILAAHKIARDMGFSSIVLLGHATYYPRFGYVHASQHGIRLPFDVPDENYMVMALQEDGLEGVSGMVVYPKAFFLDEN